MVKRLLRMYMLLLIAMFILIAAVGVVSIHYVTKDAVKNLMHQTITSQQTRYNDVLKITENSVNMLATFANHALTTADGLGSASNSFKIEALNLAEQFSAISAVYFEYDPEFTVDEGSEFIIVRSENFNNFIERDFVSIDGYERTDPKVNWYYGAVSSGHGIWTDPYYCDVTSHWVISYSAPVYTGYTNHIVGVVGMDIDIYRLIQMSSQGMQYPSSQFFLVVPNKLLTYTWYPETGIKTEYVSSSLYKQFSSVEDLSEFQKYHSDDGEDYYIQSAKLTNGLRLLLTVKVSETLIARRRMALISVCIMAVFLAIGAYFITTRTQAIEKPLKKLTLVAQQYALGNWNESYSCHSADEIQDLSEAISLMAQTTRKSFEIISRQAYKDALTGLKNKASFDEYVQKVIRNDSGAYNTYALILFDVNFLKKANDEYGHEIGDQLLINAGRFICDTFRHSPVFRIGGDEFVSILYTSDFEIRDKLLESFRNEQDTIPSGVPGMKLSVASGMAVFPDDAADYNVLFEIADARMYENKKLMKGERTD